MTKRENSMRWLGSRHPQDQHLCPLCGGPRNCNSPLEIIEDVVYYAGGRVHMSPRETAFLGLLLKRVRQPVHKEAMYNHLFGALPDCDWPEVKILDVFVCKVRRRLENAKVPVVIETIWGRGWLLREVTDVPSAS